MNAPTYDEHNEPELRAKAQYAVAASHFSALLVALEGATHALYESGRDDYEQRARHTEQLTEQLRPKRRQLEAIIRLVNEAAP